MRTFVDDLKRTKSLFSFPTVCCLSVLLFFSCLGIKSAEPPGKSSLEKRKIEEETNRRANRLADETSPYLLQHAHNPVDWFAWGSEALEKAKREGKLIFLSIGYSSCHWCHVMERESFEDQQIAEYLNKHFVCIKVDREERPDLDEIYMMALQLQGQQGGWPLTMFLTPEAEPLLGGTYFPPHDKEIEVPGGPGEPPRTATMRGLLPLLKLVVEAWQNKKEELLSAAEKLSQAVSLSLNRRGIVGLASLGEETPKEVYQALEEQYDDAHGGFGFNAASDRVPKFPEPTNLEFLLAYQQQENEESALKMVLHTLDRIAAGGIHDHVGGGFHRYSTDRHWRVPHFEKMLYDNAQLASIYAEAYRITGESSYRRVVERLLRFVEREMTTPDGAFVSALDADTDEEEGAYYVWSDEELTASLTPAPRELLGKVHAISHEYQLDGRWVLGGEATWAQTAKKLNIEEPELYMQLDSLYGKLLEQRSKRSRPRTDTKILAAWNGLMIRGLADAGRCLDEPEYLRRAARAAQFVLKNMTDKEGRLQRVHAGGKARLNAYLEDYAFVVEGLLALHRADKNPHWLKEARRLTDLQIQWYWDATGKGFFFTSKDHDELIARAKNPTDSAIPSANAVSASNLLQLSRLCDAPEYRVRAEETIQAFSGFFEHSPTAMPRMGMALMELLETKNEKGM